MGATGTVRLTRPIERKLREGHPWVYRDAAQLNAKTGDFAKLLDTKGRLLGRGIVDAGDIAMRVWTLRDEELPRILERRVVAALSLRDHIALPDTSAMRLINGEGDRCPGLVLDEYGSESGRFAVLRLDGQGIRARLGDITQSLEKPLKARGIDALLLRRPRGKAKGTQVEVLWGPTPPDPITIREHGMALVVSLLHGQKTGLFLDHRESRWLVRQLSRERRVLNLYAYTGGFSVAAGLGEAMRVTSVDIAAPAMELAEASWQANGLEPSKHQAVADDVPRYLQQSQGQLDLIVSDPPSFAPRADAVEAALSSYIKLHSACLKRLAAGGLYLAASCSSHITMDMFVQTLVDGSRQAKRTLQVLERRHAPADHPRLLAFPESDYLKVVLCRPLD